MATAVIASARGCKFSGNLVLRGNFRKFPQIYHIKGVMSVYLSVCMWAMAGQTAGPIKTKLSMGTHVDPECFSHVAPPGEGQKNSLRENRGPQGRDNSVWRTAEARSAERIEFAAAAWRKPIKLLTEARKGRETRGPQGRDNCVRRTAEARGAETIEFANRICHRLAKANKTPYRGPQGPRE